MKVPTHPRDARIGFEADSHTYFIDGSSKGVKSVSSFLSRFFPEFDSPKIAEKVFNKNYNNTKSFYYGMDVQEIVEYWDRFGKQERDKGTMMHSLIENHELGNELDQIALNERRDEMDKFFNFKRDHEHLTPYRPEWMIFNEDYNLCGTIDMLYTDNEGGFHMVDWKRSKEIKEHNPFENALEPISYLSSCNANEYSLQQNFYARFLEEKYDIPVSSMSLCVLHPQKEDYYLYKIPRMTKEVDLLLSYA